MKNRSKIAIVAFSTALSLVLIFGALLGQDKKSDEPYRPLAVLSEVLSRIQTDYVEDPSFPKVTEGALHGMLESLDPYSSYLSPDEYKEYQKTHPGDASVGLVVSKRFGLAGVVTVLPKTPAAEAGLEPGDIIESIDGHSTREMSLAEVNTRLLGQPNTTVTLTVVRERSQEPKPFPLKRREIVLPDVEARMLESGIGYLKVDAFPKGESQKIASRIKDLRKMGAKKFILDLRDNAYGEEQEGVATANLFIRKGLLAYLEGQQYPRQSFLADDGKAICDEPLTVLVNESTGGAAEIVAGAVLDIHRGEVIGSRTFGIGSVQKVIPLEDGSALILSVAKYYSPSGKQIQESGITPSIQVEQERAFVSLNPDEAEEEPEQPTKPTEDLPLKRAIELLQQSDAQPKAA